VLRTTPPYRADHVGSLLRPPRLLAAREQYADGRISADQLRAVEDDAIAEVVAMQEDVGLQSATDGEFRRSSWHMDYIYQLGGVSRGQEQLKVDAETHHPLAEHGPLPRRAGRDRP
jgi:5-methyltetrahydropteroyltriglutamate--homocysteine methyltransferase